MSQKASEDTRTQVLKITADLLKTYGYHGFNLGAVAKAVGVRKASLYYHFPDGKEELVTQALEYLVRRHGAAYREALEYGTTAERLEAILNFVLIDEGVSGAVVDSVRFLSEDRQTHVTRLFFEQQYGAIKAVLDRGVERGDLRTHDTSLSAWMFLGSVSELGRVWDKTDETFSKKIVSLFLDGVTV